MNKIGTGTHSRKLTWNPKLNQEYSLKQHLKSFDRMKDEYEWDDKKATFELTMSLSGSAQKYVNSLPKSTREGYKTLKEKLKEVYIIKKDETVKLNEFSAVKWDGKSSLKELAAQLETKLSLLTASDEDDEEKEEKEDNNKTVNHILLRQKFIEAIRHHTVKFATHVEMFAPDESRGTSKENYTKLVDWAAKIYPTFKVTTSHMQAEEEEEALFFTANDWGNQYKRQNNMLSFTDYRNNTAKKRFDRENSWNARHEDNYNENNQDSVRFQQKPRSRSRERPIGPRVIAPYTNQFANQEEPKYESRYREDGRDEKYQRNPRHYKDPGG